MSQLIHFYATSKISEHIKSIPKMERSKFIREAIEEKIDSNSTPDYKLNQAEQMKKEAELLKKQAEKQKQEIKKEKKNFESLSKAEESFLIDAKLSIEKNSLFFEGRRKSYISLFGKQISKNGFQDLLDKTEIKEAKKWIINQ